MIKGWVTSVAVVLGIAAGCGTQAQAAPTCARFDTSCMAAVATSLGNKVGNDRIKCERVAGGNKAHVAHVQCYDRLKAWTGTSIVVVWHSGVWRSTFVIMPDNTVKRMPVRGRV
jgi:hypothetical protein